MDWSTTNNVIWLIAVAFGFILAVLWILLPFALFGTKALLRELIAEQQRTNSLLERRTV
jgi:cytochrome b subunit of formate dehydrogenase